MAGQKQQSKNGSGAGGESQFKILADNRQARFNYELLDRYEAGLVLTGTEVKAARTGRINLQDAFAEVENGEAWLINAHFSPYTHGNRYNHEPVRKRKMLLHRGEIDKIYCKTRDKGFTLVPTRVFLKDGLVKCELALARGKKHHDKRESEKKREQEAEARAAVGRRAKGS
ncbi:MAG: SsrA-binding protein SmpB [Acidobacteria bacterium]|nr:SsrA-binding protein SmpB [Acidobacteriota bacterium]